MPFFDCPMYGQIRITDQSGNLHDLLTVSDSARLNGMFHFLRDAMLTRSFILGELMLFLFAECLRCYQKSLTIEQDKKQMCIKTL